MTFSDSRLCIAGPHRLAFRLTGLAAKFFVTRDSVQAMRLDPEGIDAWCDPRVNYAEAIVNIEAAQRSTAPAQASRPNPSPHSNAAWW